jgi:multidrug efflux pump subunit AcrA (membrane-fusion protein)
MLRISILLACVLATLLLGACGLPTAASTPTVAPTPTALPADPALERPLFPVIRGPITRTLELPGRITPVDLTVLSFRASGTIAAVNVRRGDVITEGMVLAELLLDEQREDLQLAQDNLTQAERALARGQDNQARTFADRQRELARAQESLAELLEGVPPDKVRAAQRAIESAERNSQTVRNSSSVAKNDAETALANAADALVNAQTSYSRADWNYRWVEQYGTDPLQPTKTNAEGRTVPNKLSEIERNDYRAAFIQATNDLRAAERAVEVAQRAADQAREAEVIAVQEAETEIVNRQEELETLLSNTTNRSETRAARDAVAAAQSALSAARNDGTIDDLRTAVENARRELARRQRKIDEGQIIAPRSGVVQSVNLVLGESSKPFEGVIEIGDPTALEIAAQVSADQTRQLAEGQPVEIRLLARPDTPLPGQIRRIPGGPASGGTLADRDQSLRITPTGNQPLRLGDVVRVIIILERKPNALLLPPEAIRTFEGRQFVVIRSGSGAAIREQRVPVRLGIQTDNVVEVLSGVSAGDLVVGP